MKKYLISLLMVLSLLSACRDEIVSQENVFLTPPAISINVTRENCPSMEIQLGTQVWWMNGDTITLPILVAELDADGNVIITGKSEINADNRFSVQFDHVGTYHVYCSESRDVYATIKVK